MVLAGLLFEGARFHVVCLSQNVLRVTRRVAYERTCPKCRTTIRTLTSMGTAVSSNSAAAEESSTNASTKVFKIYINDQCVIKEQRKHR
jgi:hypothetical protein